MYLKKIILPALLAINISIHAQSLPTYVPSDGLVGWWPFTGNAGDSSTYGNNGVVFNAALATDRFGKAGSAYSFNGFNSRIEVADAASLRCRKITMSVWVLNKNVSKIGQIIYKASLNADNEAYSVFCNNDSKQGSAVKIGSNCVTTVGWKGLNYRRPAQQGNWEHLVTTFDGSIYRLYKNGGLDTSISYSGLMDSCIGGGLRFGFNHTRFSTSTGDPFNGTIDDIGIWNRALDSSEISRLYSDTTVSTGNGNTGINISDPQRNLHIKDVLRLEPRGFSPPNPSKGDMYFDSTSNKLRVFDGSSWKDCW